LTLLLAGGQFVAASGLNRLYIDEAQNVHVVTKAGKDVRVSKGGGATKATLSPDGETAAWLVSPARPAEGEAEAGTSELAIYRSGRMRTIRCEPFIRDYWFWRKGSRVAIDCGGAHFAGREILYDAKTLKRLDSFEQAMVPTDKRPAWSASSDQFDGGG
jgi:hypothetical protein